jgi:hypothetical protein
LGCCIAPLGNWFCQACGAIISTGNKIATWIGRGPSTVLPLLSPPIFIISHPIFHASTLGLLSHEDEGTMILQNVGNCLPSNTA